MKCDKCGKNLVSDRMRQILKDIEAKHPDVSIEYNGLVCDEFNVVMWLDNDVCGPKEGA